MIAPGHVMSYTKLYKIAGHYGYDLALHDSMMREFDLVAIPCTDDVESTEKLLKAFINFVKKNEKIQMNFHYDLEKSHGRVVYVIFIEHNGHYLDISIMTKQQKRKKII